MKILKSSQEGKKPKSKHICAGEDKEVGEKPPQNTEDQVPTLHTANSL